ncbi:NAD-dependent epimerase/dehydratase family protein [uncultured Phenylobacterium sp.]|uniref:NAD-dependent epimerase/dehydratase family protein n=1 Tax=uncultured Phenylobacterium sp. TaxID=349273 RepID=UPI0025EF5131|nr:NAD-dependent epimerase/dehydratase family protein [uncultured Phenylobacterium sp.]
MRVLVTGGNRYIGLDLVRELARRGHEVTVVNSHESPLPDGVGRIHCDRTQPGALAEALGSHRDAFDVIFDHTAYRPADMEPMIELFRGRVRHYVFTSSQAVYRRSFVQPLREDFQRHAPDNADPRTAYGVGKVQCEDHLLGLWRSEGLPVTILRVGHTLGPRSPAATRDPGFFARIEQGRPILIPGDGFAAMSLVHTKDVARLMASLIGNERVKGEAYNVSGTEVTTIVGVMHLIARAMGKTVQIVNVPSDLARRLNPPLLHWGEGVAGTAILAVDKALHDIDWTPQFGIEDGYRDSYDWFVREGRDRYEFDFSRDEALLQELGV